MKELAPDKLLEACGAEGPLELIVERPGDSRRVVLPQPFALVGRSDSADLFLDHPEISARHLYLQVLDGRVFGVDLGSRTGTRWPGPAGSSAWIGPGAAVVLGPFALRLPLGGPARPLPAGDDSPLVPANVPGVRLNILRGREQQSSWLMDRRLALVGRSDVCQVRLIENSVSRVHCSLVGTPAGLLVLSLGGRHGVTVNETPVRVALLEEGDRVTVGAYVLQVAEGAAHQEDTLVTTGLGMLMLSPPAVPARVTPPSLLSAPFPAELANDSVMGMLLLRLMEQFGRMQQQMYENFQQTLLAALQLTGRPPGATGEPREEQAGLGQVLAEVQQLRSDLKQPNGAGSGSTRPQPAGAPVPPRPAPSPVQAPAELHAALCDQLRSLEEEGKSRWRKLLDLITGGGQRSADS